MANPPKREYDTTNETLYVINSFVKHPDDIETLTQEEFGKELTLALELVDPNIDVMTFDHFQTLCDADD